MVSTISYIRELMDNHKTTDEYYKLFKFLRFQIGVMIRYAASFGHKSCPIALDPLIRNFITQRTTLDYDSFNTILNLDMIINDLKKYFEEEDEGFKVYTEGEDFLKYAFNYDLGYFDLIVSWE